MDDYLIIEHLHVSFYITYIIRNMLGFSLDCMISGDALVCDHINQTQSLTCQKLLVFSLLLASFECGIALIALC